jgi:fructose/tagatose bisphosphate aldolase
MPSFRRLSNVGVVVVAVAVGNRHGQYWSSEYRVQILSGAEIVISTAVLVASWGF